MTGPSSHLRRYLPRALLCAGLGLCATVAVSWACALWSPLPTPRFSPSAVLWADGKAVKTYQQQTHSGFGVSARTVVSEVVRNAETGEQRATLPEFPPSVAERFAGAFEIAGVTTSPPGALNGHAVSFELVSVELRAGWPMPSFSYRSVDEGHAASHGGDADLAAIPGIEPPRMSWLHSIPERKLPWSPIFLGIVVDSMLFGAFSWLALFGWRGLIHRCQDRNVRCTECGLDLADQETCPRCGSNSAVMAHAERTPEVAR